MPHLQSDDIAKILLAGVLVALFASLAFAVAPAAGPLEFDRQIVALMAPLRRPSANLPMEIATYLCSWQAIVGGAAVVIIVLAIRRRQRIAILILVAVVGDQVIVSGLKTLIHRVRPDQALAILPAAGSSFPSGHTFICVAFYGLLAGLVVRRMGSLPLKILISGMAVLWVLIVATSRVYLGAHWPTDVLGSCLLGGAWITLLLMFDVTPAKTPEIERLKAD